MMDILCVFNIGNVEIKQECLVGQKVFNKG